jgi:hypothetical protein
VTPARADAGAPAARHFILGTAGHVDHGKTELVRALTGHDTDRLKEEKERGISIRLGFAPLELAPGVFIWYHPTCPVTSVSSARWWRARRHRHGDAPGCHGRGVMPQTVEHVEECCARSESSMASW